MSAPSRRRVRTPTASSPSRVASPRRSPGFGTTSGRARRSPRTSRRATACSAEITRPSWRRGSRTDACRRGRLSPRFASLSRSAWRTSPRTGSSSSSSGGIFLSSSRSSTVTPSSSPRAPRAARWAEAGTKAAPARGATTPPRSPRGRRARPDTRWWTPTCASWPRRDSCPTEADRTSRPGSRSTPGWTGGSAPSGSRTSSWTMTAPPTGVTGSPPPG